MSKPITHIAIEAANAKELEIALARMSLAVAENPQFWQPKQPIGFDISAQRNGETVQVKGVVW